MLLATALLLLVAAAVPADPASQAEVRAVQVMVDAAAGCADAERFFASLRARTPLVRRAAENEPRAKLLRVRLAEQRHLVSGELRMLDDRGEVLTRKVQGATCDDVMQALALTAAVALDPSVLLPPLEAQPPSRAAPAAASVAPPSTAVPATVAVAPPREAPVAREAAAVAPASTTPAPAASVTTTSGTSASVTSATRPAPRFLLGAASVVAFPLPSGPSLGLALFGRWTSTASPLRPSLGLAISYLRNDVLRAPDAVEASLFRLIASACGMGWSASVMTVEPCASLGAGRLSATGDEALHPRAVDVLWLAAGAGARATVDLGAGFVLHLEAGVSVPLLRREFYVSSPNHVVDRTSTVSPEGALGIGRGF